MVDLSIEPLMFLVLNDGNEVLQGKRMLRQFLWKMREFSFLSKMGEKSFYRQIKMGRTVAFHTVPHRDTHTHTPIHTHTYIHTPTYTHIHIHTHKKRIFKPPNFFSFPLSPYVKLYSCCQGLTESLTGLLRWVGMVRDLTSN